VTHGPVNAQKLQYSCRSCVVNIAIDDVGDHASGCSLRHSVGGHADTDQVVAVVHVDRFGSVIITKEKRRRRRAAQQKLMYHRSEPTAVLKTHRHDDTVAVLEILPAARFQTAHQAWFDPDWGGNFKTPDWIRTCASAAVAVTAEESPRSDSSIRRRPNGPYQHERLNDIGQVRSLLNEKDARALAIRFQEATEVVRHRP